MVTGEDTQAHVRAWVSSPVTLVMLITTVFFGLWHAALGLQVVIEDYVHGDGWKLALIVGVRFIAVIFGLAAVVAILRIGLGG